MRVTIHQPEHLPWLGLLSKIRASDLWIVLDQVAYRKNYFQNRNRVLLDGQPVWLTVPVKPRSGTPIKDVIVSSDPTWGRKYVGRVKQALPDAARQGRLEPLIDLIEATGTGDSLLDLNLAISDWLMAEFGVSTPRVSGAQLGGQGAKSSLILSLCVSVGATTYLAGPSGREYLELESFQAAGIAVEFFDFEHPPYPQRSTEFASGMSALEPYGLLSKAELPRLLDNYELART